MSESCPNCPALDICCPTVRGWISVRDALEMGVNCKVAKSIEDLEEVI